MAGSGIHPDLRFPKVSTAIIAIDEMFWPVGSNEIEQRITSSMAKAGSDRVNRIAFKRKWVFLILAKLFNILIAGNIFPNSSGLTARR